MSTRERHKREIGEYGCRSDDKRRLRLLEEELRMAKEATVRLHDDLMRAEERRQRHQDDLDRVKNTLNESESRRLCLQNQLDTAQNEVRSIRLSVVTVLCLKGRIACHAGRFVRPSVSYGLSI